MLKTVDMREASLSAMQVEQILTEQVGQVKQARQVKQVEQVEQVRQVEQILTDDAVDAVIVLQPEVMVSHVTGSIINVMKN